MPSAWSAVDLPPLTKRTHKRPVGAGCIPAREGVETEMRFLVMELVEGETLVVTRGELSRDAVLIENFL